MTERRDLSLVAGADLVNHRLVKLSSGQAVYNTETSTDNPVGATKLNVKSGEDVSINPLNKEGTMEICAAGAISQGDDVFAAADGKIQALPAGAGTYRRIGMAMAAASGDGSIIEVLPYGYTDTETVT
jgi:hypothetical protein